MQSPCDVVTDRRYMRGPNYVVTRIVPYWGRNVEPDRRVVMTHSDEGLTVPEFREGAPAMSGRRSSGRSVALRLQEGDELDLHEGIECQRGDLNGGPGGRLGWEGPCVDIIEGLEIRKVGEKTGGLDDPVH